jgi:hypothetical protein
MFDNRRDYVPGLEDIAKHDPLKFPGKKPMTAGMAPIPFW